MIFIYCIIILSATFFGAFAGLGGGVIIKPLLDLIGHDTIDVVNFISSCAVFSMSISSTLRHIKAKTKIDSKFVLVLSVGAVAGGICGGAAFNFLLTIFNNNLLKSIQGIILGIFLVMAVVYVNKKNAKSFNVENRFGIILVGLALGFLASFLGVGGGPINVAFLVLFFSMTMKEATIYSIAIIFFSQLSKLASMTISHTIPQIDILTILFAIASAVIGGILGATVNKKSNEKVIKTTYTIIVTLLALVNFYNAAAGFVN